MLEIFASRLDGIEYNSDLSGIASELAEHNLIAVMGGSDDRLEFIGRVRRDVDVFDLPLVRIGENGVIGASEAYSIQPVRGRFSEDEPYWTYRSDLPSAAKREFTLYSDGALWCRGFIFDASVIGLQPIEITRKQPESQTTFRALLGRYGLPELWYILSKKHNRPPMFSERLHDAYQSAYVELKSLPKSRPREGVLRCKLVVDPSDSTACDPYVDCALRAPADEDDEIRRIKKGDMIDWAFEFSPWRALIDLPVERESIERLGGLVCAAEILWEVTFNGYSSSQVEEEGYMGAMIHSLTASDLPEYAEVIRGSFATVAQDFGWMQENAPTFTAYITNEKLAEKLKDGYFPFGLCVNGKIVGFVSLTAASDGTYELNQLAVLPEYRHLGFGKKLLDWCKAKVREFGGEKIKIGIVDENIRLKEWYAENDFVHTGTKKFDWQPFTAGFMEWTVPPSSIR
jgi:ribosomal protein S18 acetylase RimI-like enzyme